MSRSRTGKVSAMLGYLAFAAIPAGLVLKGVDRVGEVSTCEAGMALMYLGAPLLALLGIVVGVVAGSNGGQAWKVGSLAFLVVLAGYFFFYPPMMHACWRVTNDASAVGSLRTLNTAIVQYQSTYGKPPASLAQLGPAPQSQPPAEASAEHADLLDSVLAGGQKSGYQFVYAPGPLDGRPFRYTIVARPIRYRTTGQRNFFTDETGEIRSTREDRPATKDDPPIG